MKTSVVRQKANLKTGVRNACFSENLTFSVSLTIVRVKQTDAVGLYCMKSI